MKKILIPLCLIFCSFCSLAQPRTLRIDPADAHGGTASQVFQEVNFIPLETTKESLFGKIDQLAVTEKYFIILDEDTNSILIFEKNGKFHAKISGGGNLSDEGSPARFRKMISDFVINPYTKQIEIKAFHERKVYNDYYNFNGKKVKQTLPVFDIRVYHYFDKNTVGYFTYQVVRKSMPDSIGYEVFVTKNNKIYKKYLPYNTKHLINRNIVSMSSSNNILEMGNDTSVFVVRPYDYNIYQLTPNSFTSRYHLVFPLANTLPKGFATDSVFKGKRFKFIQKNPNLIYHLGNTYRVGNNLFFKVGAFGGLGKNDSFIYNEKSGNLICINRITPDSSTSFLPITDVGLGVDFANNNFGFCDGKYVYTAYSSLTMFQTKESTADKNPVYPSVLESYFKTESRKSNPVIVQLKPKRNL